MRARVELISIILGAGFLGLCTAYLFAMWFR
jgi:hypothetical protein